VAARTSDIALFALFASGGGVFQYRVARTAHGAEQKHRLVLNVGFEQWLRAAFRVALRRVSMGALRRLACVVPPPDALAYLAAMPDGDHET
jgi:hypothetical protein